MRERGQNQGRRMRMGQTIVAERERAESESERMQARRQLRKKRTTAVAIGALMVAVLGLLVVLGVNQLTGDTGPEDDSEIEYVVSAQIVDEDGRGQISVRVKAYIAELTRAFADLGYTVAKVTLPTGASRELYVDLVGVEPYFKVTIDRGAAVTAEDAERMMRYLGERELAPAYVDVRVEGRAYYR